MTSRTTLGSPYVSLGLGAVLLALVALALVPGVLPGAGGRPSPGTPSASVAPAVTPSPTFGYPTPSPAPTFTAYEVRAGDSLTSIANAFRTTPRSIAWWNRGTYPTLDPESPGYKPNDIKPGWTLVLIPGTVVDEENPPSPSPPPVTPEPTASLAPTTGPTPRPTASPKPSASPTSAPEAATIVTHGSRSGTGMALTFDMGGRVTPALDIVNWLIDHQVHATIFPTGETATTTTGKAVLALVAAHPELFDVGNHSWDHPYFTQLTAAQMASQLTKAEAAVAPLAGQTTKPWFRPPYGAVNLAVQRGVAAAGWDDVVKWDVDTIDWKKEIDGGPSVADMVAKVSANARAGSIVLMHLGGYNTFDALPGILAAIEDKGLRPVTLGELLGH